MDSLLLPHRHGQRSGSDVPGVVSIALPLALVDVKKPTWQLWNKPLIKMHFVNAETEDFPEISVCPREELAKI